MRTGNLFVFSGPSGAGKGTLMARLMQRIPGAWLSVSATTRAPREGEVDGESYLFLSDEQFSELESTGGLLEWAQVHENKYGTPKHLVEQHIEAGDQVFLEIDVQGAFQVRKLIPSAHLVFIEPPSLEILEERLRGRGTDSESSIQVRMHNARVELSQKMEYDICFTNDNLDECTDALVAYIERQANRDEGI